MTKTKIALVGVGDPEWLDALKDTYRKKGAVYTWWTFNIRDYETMLLEEQLEEDGEFKLYFYNSKKGGGDMKIGLVGRVTRMSVSPEYLECPEPEFFPQEFSSDVTRRTWLKVTTLDNTARTMELNEFWDYRTNRAITPSHLRSSFAYVADTEQIKTEVVDESGEEDYFDLTLEEAYMENEIAANPEMMGLGPLELLYRQRVTPVGRPDLIFKSTSKSRILIVELKKYELTNTDVSQAERYFKWGKKEFGANIVCVLIGYGTGNTDLPRLTSLDGATPGVYTLVYEASLRIV